SPALFQLVDAAHTGISFNNRLTETGQMNALNYDYMYNGAGVSVGDFNQDGLPDLYFVANQLPNRLYLNKGDLKFEDITNISGTAGKQGFSTGTTVVDINADGLLDIYVCRSGSFPDSDQRRNELFINQGNNGDGIPIFKEQARDYNLDLPHYSTQASFFDYDRDGDLDLFLINHNINSQVHYDLKKYRQLKSVETGDRLFRNEGNTFIDVSEEAGILIDGIGFGLGLAVGDLNNDQWPDVVVGQDFASKDRIYLNLKNGKFQEVASEVTGHLSNFSMGNDMADFNNDGWLDFMSLDMVSEDNYGIKASMSGMNPERFHELVEGGFHHQYMYNTLQLNNGTAEHSLPYFSDLAALAGVSSTDWSWGPLFFDMDNDGDKDLFISNGIKRDFRNVDYLHYRERAENAFLEKVKEVSSTLRAVVQQQHDSDLIRRMPPRLKNNYFYENNGDLGFTKRTGEWAPERLDASNGAAYADLDNDGDLDLVTNNMDELASVYRNNSTEQRKGNFIKIVLQGPPKNPDGIGARVKIETEQKKQLTEQYVSRGFQSSIDHVIHFGIGKETEIKKIVVRWPDGMSTSIQPRTVNQTLPIKYANASTPTDAREVIPSFFTTIPAQAKLNHLAKEDDFDDFQRESLLPHKMSREGPALAVGDVNKDGLDDCYIGGSKGTPGSLYIQQPDGTFQASQSTIFQNNKAGEEVDAVFFDMDDDGDLDLYVVNGSNEFELDSKWYQDQIYINRDGQFRAALNPFSQEMKVSGSVVCPHDFDGDGDLDLFVGGRQTPGQYPHPGTSVIWRNESTPGHIHFTKFEEPLLDRLGMVTDALWADVDGDQQKELIVVGEWMSPQVLKFDGKDFSSISQGTALEKEVGWWFCIEAADVDQDGDLDLVAGNLGLNSKYQASIASPFQIFAKDFDQTGTLDIVLAFEQNEEVFPLRGRECSSNQMPFIKKKFPDYHSFASANMQEVYGEENLATSLQFSASNFASTYFENKGNGQFAPKALPRAAQVTTTRKIITHDANGDGHLDLLLLGNRYDFEVETPRQDAGYGTLLLGNGQGDFRASMAYESGLFVKGSVVDAAEMTLSDGQQALLIAKNNAYLQLVSINKARDKKYIVQ
nr:VCBS repeat-containing protein [Saprospiraceae bacterium]